MRTGAAVSCHYQQTYLVSPRYSPSLEKSRTRTDFMWENVVKVYLAATVVIKHFFCTKTHML